MLSSLSRAPTRLLRTGAFSVEPGPPPRRLASTIAAGGAASPSDYCRSLVSSKDYEAHLLSYFYPSWARDGYYSLRALNVELATIKENVSSEMIGRMRMQFWRDAVKSAFEGRPPSHPVALALAKAIHDPRSRLQQFHFKRLIDAREKDLASSTAPPTSESIESYSESTASTLLYAQLSLLSLSSSTYDHAASHLGKAIGIVTLLRSLPFHLDPSRFSSSHPPPSSRRGSTGSMTGPSTGGRGERKLVLPVEFCAKHGVVQEEVFRKGPEAKGLRDAVFETATLANDHLITARSFFKEAREGKPERKIDEEVLPVLLAAVPAQSYLTRLEAADFHPFEPSLNRARYWKLPWQVWTAVRRREV